MNKQCVVDTQRPLKPGRPLRLALNLILTFFLSLLVWLCAPASLQASQTPPQEERPTMHIVRAGDTLYTIASRYGVNVALLAHLNGLSNPDMIYVGQHLVLPAGSPALAPTPTGDTPSVHVVQAGETLFRIALQHGSTVWAIASANQLENPSFIYTGQRLIIPTGETVTPSTVITGSASDLPAPFASLDIAPQPVVQGYVLLVTVHTLEAVTLQGSFLDWIIPFAGPLPAEENTYYALIGIHALQTAGVYPLALTASTGQGQPVSISHNVTIVEGKFGFERINLPASKQSLLDPALIQAERDRLWSVFSIFRQERYWTGLFGLPVQGKVSSVFGTRRSYNGPFNSYHEGIDFSANGGTPVVAPAAGIVVLAEALTVRGNAVILDHGWGVHTGFYHLSEIGVTPGQMVQTGEMIGRVGSTGLSTGAHLHWDMRVRGLNVNPLEWTSRSFPY